VEVIGQEAIGQQSYTASIDSLLEKLHELGVVAGIVEDLDPSISSVENVVTKASSG